MPDISDSQSNLVFPSTPPKRLRPRFGSNQDPKGATMDLPWIQSGPASHPMGIRKGAAFLQSQLSQPNPRQQLKIFHPPGNIFYLNRLLPTADCLPPTT